MARMVRKQLYIDSAQEGLLKSRAKRLGVTEAEVMRAALDAYFAAPGEAAPGWERLAAALEKRRAEPPLPERPRRWSREEIYEERESRFRG